MSFLILLFSLLPHITPFDLIIDPLTTFQNRFTSFNLREILKESEEKGNYSILLRNADYYLDKTFQIKNEVSLSGENASLIIKEEGQLKVEGRLSVEKIIFVIQGSSGTVFNLKGNLNFKDVYIKNSFLNGKLIESFSESNINIDNLVCINTTVDRLIAGSLSSLSVNSSFFFDSQAKEEFIEIEAENFQLKATKFINFKSNGSLISVFNSTLSQIEDLTLLNSQISKNLIEIRDSLGVNISSVLAHFNVLDSIISLSSVSTACINLLSSTSNYLLSSALHISQSFRFSLTNSAFFNLSSFLLLISSSSSSSSPSSSPSSNPSFLHPSSSFPYSSSVPPPSFSSSFSFFSSSSSFSSSSLPNTSSFYLGSILIEGFILSSSTPPPSSLLLFQLASFSILIISDLKVYNIDDSSLGNSHLISIVAPDSDIILELFWVKNCRFMLSLFEITGKTIIFTDSLLVNNQNLGFRMTNYFSSSIFERNITLLNNSAFISMITINPVDFFDFQEYLAVSMFFEANTVDLFGACIKFTPTNNGNYTIKQSTMLDSVSKYMSGVIDIFCTNPTLEKTYYILEKTVIVGSRGGEEGGVASFFFHDNAYTGVVKECVFAYNYAEKGGTFIFSLDNPANRVLILSSIFFFNSAEGGGAISAISGTILIYSSFFIENFAFRGGSIETINFNNLKLYNTTIENSFSLIYGGAFVLIDNSNFFGEQLEIKGSQSKFGGVFYFDSFSTLSLSNSTVKTVKGQAGSLIFLSKSGGGGMVGGLGGGLIIDCSVEGGEEGSLFFVDHSKIWLERVVLQRIRGLVFLVSNSELRGRDVKIGGVEGGEEGGAFKLIRSYLEIRGGEIIGVTSVGKGGGVYAIKSEVQMEGVRVENIEAKKGSLAYFLESKVNMSYIYMRNIEKNGVYGEGGELTMVWIELYTYKDYLNDSNGGSDGTFQNSSNNTDEGLYQNNSNTNIFDDSKESFLILKALRVLLIENSKFVGWTGIKDGGILHITDRELESLTFSITNSSFEGCKGANGGVIYLQDVSLNILNSEFNLNEGINGGVVYFTCSDYKSERCQLNLASNIFSNNHATNHGGVLAWMSKRAMTSQNDFLNNSALHYGNITSSFPVKLHYVSNNSSSFLYLPSLLSGGPLPPLSFTLVDADDQEIKNFESFINISVVTVAPPLFLEGLKSVTGETGEIGANMSYSEGNSSQLGGEEIDGRYGGEASGLEGETLVFYNYSSFEVGEVKVVGRPTTTVYIIVSIPAIPVYRLELMGENESLNHYSYQSNTSSSPSYLFILPSSLLPCPSGSLYISSTNLCSSCPPSSYSFNPFQKKCEECPKHTDCPGANKVVTHKNFWRKDQLSARVYACNVMLGSCLGESCLAGYTGVRCEVCVFPLQKNWLGFCSQCPEDWSNWIISLSILGVTVTLVGIGSSWVRRKMGEEKEEGGILRVLINYSQMMMIMPNFTFKNYRNEDNFLGLLAKNWFSFDCLLNGLKNFVPESVNRRILGVNVAFAAFFYLVYLICSDGFWLFLVKLRDFLRVLGERQLFTRTFQRSNSLAKANREKSRSNKSDEEEGRRKEEGGRRKEEGAIKMERKGGEEGGRKEEERKKEGGGLEEKRRRTETKLLCFVAFLAYFVQVGMIELSIAGFRCMLIEDVYYNRYDMSYECWNMKHIIWVVVIYLPSLLFWIVGINMALLKLERMRKSRMRGKEIKEKDKGKIGNNGKEVEQKTVEGGKKEGETERGREEEESKKRKEEGGRGVGREEEGGRKKGGKEEEGCKTAGGRIEGQKNMLFLRRNMEEERRRSGMRREEVRRRSSGSRSEVEERKRKEEEGSQLICFIGVKRAMRKYDIWLSIFRYLGILFLSMGLEEDMEGVYFMQFCVFACSFLVYFQFKPYEGGKLNKLNLLMMFVVLSNFYFLAIVKIFDEELVSQLFHAFYIVEHVILGGIGVYGVCRRNISEWREETRRGSFGMKNYRNVVIANVIYV